MARTVASILAEIDDMVQEDATFSSGLWSMSTELLQYFNDVELDFLRRTGIKKANSSVTGVIATRLYDAPASSMQLHRIAYGNTVLHRTTREDLDLEDTGWLDWTGPPRQYYQDTLSKEQFQTDRKPTSDTINFQVVHSVEPTALTSTSDNLNVPDAFAMYVKYGVLEKMLSKQGEGQDLKRAVYCRQRYETGIKLAQRLLIGQEL